MEYVDLKGYLYLFFIVMVFTWYCIISLF